MDAKETEIAIKQRVQQVFAECKITVNRFALQSGLNQKTINDQINGTAKIGAVTLCALLAYRPDLSAEWLLRGEGSMLRSIDAKPNNVINFGHHNSNNNVGGTQTIVTKSAQQLPTMTREEAITALINQNTDLIKLLKNK